MEKVATPHLRGASVDGDYDPTLQSELSFRNRIGVYSDDRPQVG